jgi:hypothetical protein
MNERPHVQTLCDELPRGVVAGASDTSACTNN